MENKKIKTNNVIALCHIIDDFKEFEKRLMAMMSLKYNGNFIFQLWNISKGKFKLGARKARKFYNENKSIIDTINKYSDITRFIIDNYNCNGDPISDLQFFYEYILDHKEEMGQILDVLCKLNELGFREFEFNENLDFTKEIYDADPSFRRNFRITYVANAEVIPNYVNYINYKTTSSNYKMKLYVAGENISDYNRDIVLNSLLFDSKNFPTIINRESTFDQILELKNEQEEQTTFIRHSVDLSVSVLDLENQLKSTAITLGRLDKVKNTEELSAILLNIRENIEKLKLLSTEYNSSISEQEPLLTPEVLEKEMNLYLKRRDSYDIDID